MLLILLFMAWNTNLPCEPEAAVIQGFAAMLELLSRILVFRVVLWGTMVMNRESESKASTIFLY